MFLYIYRFETKHQYFKNLAKKVINLDSLSRAVAKAAAGEALAASLLQDHVRHLKGLLTIIKVISSILILMR